MKKLNFLSYPAISAISAGITFIGIGLYQDGFATSTASTNANATANVVASIAITKVTDLQFGDVSASDPSKTMTPANCSSTTGVLNQGANGGQWGGTVTCALFTLAGEASHSYFVSGLPTGTVTMSTGGGGANKTINVTNFTDYVVSSTTSGTAGGANITGTLSGSVSSNMDQVLVGASIAAIAAGQVTGAYTAVGGVTITVTYQ